MTEDELKALRKAAKKARRIATEKAGELHDLVEERLPAAWRELPDLAEATLAACRDWEAAEETLKAAEAET